MKRRLLYFISLLTLVNIPIFGIDMEYSQLELDIQAIRSDVGEYTAEEETGVASDDFFDFGFDEDESIYDYDYKSPKKAFVYSLLIPGWGQRYCGSSAIKTLGFIAIEAGLWMGYFNYHNDGLKKTDEYEAFANDYWTEGDSLMNESYRGWLYDNYWSNLDPADRPETFGDVESEFFTHILPDGRTQQYYEMIGKYDQFATGWQDYWDDPDYYGQSDSTGLLYPTPMRLEYNVLRNDANNLLDKANNFVIFAVVNHLVSAVDAALAARRYNRGKANELWLSMDAEMIKYSATESIPVVKLALNF